MGVGGGGVGGTSAGGQAQQAQHARQEQRSGCSRCLAAGLSIAAASHCRLVSNCSPDKAWGAVPRLAAPPGAAPPPAARAPATASSPRAPPSACSPGASLGPAAPSAGAGRPGSAGGSAACAAARAGQRRRAFPPSRGLEPRCVLMSAQSPTRPPGVQLHPTSSAWLSASCAFSYSTSICWYCRPAGWGEAQARHNLLVLQASGAGRRPGVPQFAGLQRLWARGAVCSQDCDTAWIHHKFARLLDQHEHVTQRGVSACVLLSICLRCRLGCRGQLGSSCTCCEPATGCSRRGVPTCSSIFSSTSCAASCAASSMPALAFSTCQ